MSPTNPRTIDIEVDSDGNFTYTPSAVRVNPGDQVQWTSSSGPFTVVFKDKTPINAVDAQAQQGGTAAAAQSSTSIQTISRVPSGYYHYVVGLFMNGAVFMDAGCPVLIVN